jgi:hypothetical protein
MGISLVMKFCISLIFFRMLWNRISIQTQYMLREVDTLLLQFIPVHCLDFGVESTIVTFLSGDLKISLWHRESS